MRFDRFRGVDGLVAHRRVNCLVPANNLCDMGWQSVHDRVGDEYSPEVVRLKHQRIATGIGESCRRERLDEELADETRWDRAAFVSDCPLKQQRHRRIPALHLCIVDSTEGY